MNLYSDIERYRPCCPQEEADRKQMLLFMEKNADCLDRSNQTAHFSASAWTFNRARTKVLMVCHSLYDSWSWTGGHADGNEDLRSVALRELKEETGVCTPVLLTPDIFSLEILTVDGHFKRGVYVPSHLHLNVTWLVEADEADTLIVNEAENQAVKWWSPDDALKVTSEPWFAERIYRKLNEKAFSLFARSSG